MAKPDVEPGSPMFGGAAVAQPDAVNDGPAFGAVSKEISTNSAGSGRASTPRTSGTGSRKLAAPVPLAGFGGGLEFSEVAETGDSSLRALGASGGGSSTQAPETPATASPPSQHGRQKLRSTGSSTTSRQEAPPPPLPEVWTRCLAGTLTLHAVEVAMHLAHYLLQLLTAGYGTLSPLHIASWEGSVDAVSAVAAGSEDAVRAWHSRPGELMPLHVAAICGHEVVVRVLLDMRVQPDVQTVHSMGALHIAAMSNIEIVEVLLGAGAAPRMLTADGSSPLHFACCFQQLETLKVLLEAGADATVANSFGVTPLHVAVAQAALEGWPLNKCAAVLYLCKEKADPAAKDSHGLEPLRVAQLAGADPSLIAFLQGSAAGFDPLPGETLATATHRIASALVSSGAVIDIASDQLDEEEEANAKSAQMQRELEEARAQCKHLEDLLQNSKAAAEEAAANGADKDALKSAEEEVANLKAANTNMQKELEETRAQCTHLEDLLQNSKSTFEELQATSSAAHGQQSDAMEKLQRQHEEELAEVKKLAEQEAASLRQDKQDLEERLVAADLAREEASKGVEGASQEIAAKVGELDVLQAELAASKAAVAGRDNELSLLKAQVDRLGKELEETRGTLAEAHTAHSDVQKQLSDLEVQSQQAEISFKEREVALEGAKREQELKIEKLEQDMASLQEEAQLANEFRQKAEKATKRVEELEKKLQDLRTNFDKEQVLRKQMHNQLQDLKGGVRVFARIRPVVARETGDMVAVQKVDAFSLELASTDIGKAPKAFYFDAVFDGNSTQEDVFAECRSLVMSTLDGFNVTIFAYGQTGAGKTHTMYGSESMPGLVPRIAGELFTNIARYASESDQKVKVEMLELYKDDLVDLLLPRKTKGPGPLVIKNDTRGSVYVENATERQVHSADELLAAIREGQNQRHVAATKMNADSSRSHLIVVIMVETINRKTKQVASGKLSLCDLAGSERLKKSEATGDTMKEAQSINKSLTALGDVIEALTKHAKHVPYRNHKLTQMLSDSLGGNAKTLMFVNCSPVAGNADETNSSLSYAVRAKSIVNKVEKNQDSMEVSKLKKVIQVMSKELDEARAAAGIASAPDEPPLLASPSEAAQGS